MATADQLIQRLQDALPGDRLRTGAGTDGYDVGGLRPRVVVVPHSADEVLASVRVARESGAPLVPWGGGTCIDLGNPPARCEIVLDCSHLDTLVEYEPADLTATVQAGMTFAALDAKLAEHQQTLALDPPLPGRATVGGALSAGLWGPLRTGYGTARDRVIGMRAVLGTGRAVHSGGRVVKNVSGYDLHKAFLGALGTLGVIVEVSFKLLPQPRGRSALVASFADLEHAMSAARDALRAAAQPAMLEVVGPDVARRLAARTRSDPDEAAWLVVVAYAHAAGAVQRASRDFVRLAHAAGSPEVSALEPHQRPAVLDALRDYGRTEAEPAAVIVSLRGRAAQCEALAQLARRVAPAAAVIATPAVGIVRLYAADADAEQALRLVHSLREGARPLGAVALAERLPRAAVGRVDAWDVSGADLELMRRLKAAYDPDGILAPGRHVAGI